MDLARCARRLAFAGAGLGIAAAVAVPAWAAGGTWGLVYSKYYGSGDYAGYTALASVGPGDTWAFGTTDTRGWPYADGHVVAAHWNGRTWSALAQPTGFVSEIAAASAVASNDVWAVTQAGGAVIHWNGKSWTATSLPVPFASLATGITAFSPVNVWVYGNSANGPGTGTWHYNGTSWSRVSGLASTITVASAASPADIWAAASVHQTGDTLLNYAEGTWKQVSVPALSGLMVESVDAMSATNVWVSAARSPGGDPLLLHFNGTQWTQLTVPWTDGFASGITPDGAGGLWIGISGAGPFWMAHRSATGVWTQAQTSDFSDYMYSWARVPGTTSLWGAGATPVFSGSFNAAIYAYGPPK